MKPPDTVCPQCDGPVTQSGRGRPRRFCSPECGIKFANDAKPRKYGKVEYDAKRHMLTNIHPDTDNATTGTADCSKCGPRMRVWDVGGTKVVRWRCPNSVEAQPGRIKHKRGRGREESWARHGIILTVEEYDAMILFQRNLCASCGGALGEKPHVDHDHSLEPATIENGSIGGVLCQPCNRSGGLMGDSFARLRLLADYLEEHRGGTTTALGGPIGDQRGVGNGGRLPVAGTHAAGGGHR